MAGSGGMDRDGGKVLLIGLLALAVLLVGAVAALVQRPEGEPTFVEARTALSETCDEFNVAIPESFSGVALRRLTDDLIELADALQQTRLLERDAPLVRAAERVEVQARALQGAVQELGNDLDLPGDDLTFSQQFQRGGLNAIIDRANAALDDLGVELARRGAADCFSSS